jgi:hypothetical protein
MNGTIIKKNMKKLKTYKVEIWVGLQEGYDNTVIHSIDDVRVICDKWVNDIKSCVTITPTEFRYVDGSEPGVVIGLIAYPRFPKKKRVIKNHAFELAQILLIELKQKRLTVITPKKSYMLENQFITE